MKLLQGLGESARERAFRAGRCGGRGATLRRRPGRVARCGRGPAPSDCGLIPGAVAGGCGVGPVRCAGHKASLLHSGADRFYITCFFPKLGQRPRSAAGTQPGGGGRGEEREASERCFLGLGTCGSPNPCLLPAGRPSPGRGRVLLTWRLLPAALRAALGGVCEGGSAAVGVGRPGLGTAGVRVSASLD